MSINHSNTASGWLGHGDAQDWSERLGDTVRTVFEAIQTGREASHDYRLLTARGLAPQKATDKVLRKHFGKR